MATHTNINGSFALSVEILIPIITCRLLYKDLCPINGSNNCGYPTIDIKIFMYLGLQCFSVGKFYEIILLLT